MRSKKNQFQAPSSELRAPRSLSVIDKQRVSHYLAEDMLLQILKSKIHRATVTDANIDYEGSITLDEALMEAAGLNVHEMVHVWDATNGHRLYTYVMPPAPRGSGTVCINGAAAHLIQTEHIVIITSFINLTPEEYKDHKPNKILVDGKNNIVKVKHV